MKLESHNHKEDFKAALLRLEMCLRKQSSLSDWESIPWGSIFRYLEMKAIQAGAPSPKEVAVDVLREFFMPNALGKWAPPAEPIELYFQSAVNKHFTLQRRAAAR